MSNHIRMSNSAVHRNLTNAPLLDEGQMQEKKVTEAGANSNIGSWSGPRHSGINIICQKKKSTLATKYPFFLPEPTLILNVFRSYTCFEENAAVESLVFPDMLEVRSHILQ